MTEPVAIQLLVEQIRSAFASVKHPGDDRLLHRECCDDNDIQAFYGRQHWRYVDPEVYARENAALSFFSPEGFQFYLPGFMTWTLQNFQTSDSFTVDSTIYSLNPDQGDLREFTLSKYSLLTDVQRKAVLAFLEFMRDHSEGLADEDAARKAIDNHWRQFA